MEARACSTCLPFFSMGFLSADAVSWLVSGGGEGRERGEGTKREKEEDPPQPHQVGLPSFGQVTCLHIFLLLFLNRGCEGNQLMISAEDGSRTNEKKRTMNRRNERDGNDF